MAEIEWTAPARAATADVTPQWLQRLTARLTDWEDWLTLVLALGATMSVSLGLERSGWSENMPPITLVSVLAVVASLLIARSGLSILAAWPLAVLAGALVVFWQTLELVGPGDLEQRLDAIYFRFRTWFDVAVLHDEVSNDSLPFNVLVLSLTWLGVFVFGWSVYRWQNAWIGLIPGGVTLFLDLALVGDDLEGSVLLYMLFGFLLVMRTNLMARMQVWRRDATAYPSLISLSFLNFSTWVLLFLVLGAWIAPAGPFATPAPVEAMVRGIEEIGVNFVRLSGPLSVKRVVPVHSYTGVLPFQGSIELGDREVMTVSVNDTAVSGTIRLRGAAYDQYGAGGWTAGARTSVKLPAYLEENLREEIKSGGAKGRIIPLTITVERKSVVGTVLFAPGEPVGASVQSLEIEVPSSGFEEIPVRVEDAAALPLEEILADVVEDELGRDFVGLTASREVGRRVIRIGVIRTSGESLPDTLVARPPGRVGEGRSYNIAGFLPTVPPEELRQADAGDPLWVLNQYLQLPEGLPARIGELAADITAESTSRYDRAVLVQNYLRDFPVEFDVADTPPGRDTVDYFLFDSQRGYFDYHASAMTVMLRTLGIPSRLAVGFVIDEEDKDLESGAYSIRDRNSYAWTEVYFPAYGWTAFNPSPDRPASLDPQFEAAAEEPVEPGSIEDFNFGIAADPIFDLPAQSQPGEDTTPFGGQGRDYNPLITLGVAAFLALLAGSVFLGWQRSVAGLPYSQQLWEKAVRLATWGGQGPRTGQTPAEFARDLDRHLYGAEDISVLAAAYNRSRFGGREPDEERARLAEIWSPLRNVLLVSIVQRFTRRDRGRDEE